MTEECEQTDISGKFEFEGEADSGKWKFATITK